MDIHKPKPWHGLREFLKEIGTIVIGVLIALGAEQAVEWLHWRHVTHVAREALVFDFRRTIGQAARKDAYSPCVAVRIGQLSDALDQAQATKRLPPIGYGGMPLLPAWTLRSWNGLTSGQTLAHISNRDQLTLSAVNGALELAREARNQENNDWSVLMTMVGPGRPTSDPEIANLRATLGRAARDAAGQRSLGLQIEATIVRSGFLTRAQAEAAYQEGLESARTAPLCRPPEPPAADSRNALTRELIAPPTPLGKGPLYGAGVGVAGALTTER